MHASINLKSKENIHAGSLNQDTFLAPFNARPLSHETFTGSPGPPPRLQQFPGHYQVQGTRTCSVF